MYRTTGALHLARAFLLTALVLFPFAVNAANGLPCNNPHTANKLDEAAGYPPGSQVCPSVYQQSGVTPESGQAKEYLKSLPKEAKSRCGTESDESIGRLNAQFSICAANFVRAYQSTYGDPIRVNSAFRLPQQQVCVCQGEKGLCGKPGKVDPKSGVVVGGSNHQRGVAIDITPASRDYARMQAFARSNPKLGVFFPHGMGDRVHLEPATVACGRGQNVAVPGATNATPSSPITNAIRNAINPQPALQPAPVQPPPQQTQPASAPPPLGTANTTPYQAGTCAPQFYCSNNNLYYRSSSCVDRINQVCPKGCSGVSCIDAPVSTDILTTLLSSTTKPTPTATGTATRTPSVFEQLSAFAGTQAQPTKAASSTPLVLVITSKDSVSLRSQQSEQVAPTTSQGTYQLAPTQQTFVSPDLSGSPATSQYSPQQASGFQGILASLKGIVLRALEYLRPFGGATSGDGGENAEGLL